MQQIGFVAVSLLFFLFNAFIGNKLGQARRKQLQAEQERDKALKEVGLLQLEITEKERELVKQSWLIEDLKDNLNAAKEQLKAAQQGNEGEWQVVRVIAIP